MNEATEKDLERAILIYRNRVNDTDNSNRLSICYQDRKGMLSREHQAFADIIDLVKLIEGHHDATNNK